MARTVVVCRAANYILIMFSGWIYCGGTSIHMNMVWITYLWKYLNISMLDSILEPTCFRPFLVTLLASIAWDQVFHPPVSYKKEQPQYLSGSQTWKVTEQGGLLLVKNGVIALINDLINRELELFHPYNWVFGFTLKMWRIFGLETRVSPPPARL